MVRGLGVSFQLKRAKEAILGRGIKIGSGSIIGGMPAKLLKGKKGN